MIKHKLILISIVVLLVNHFATAQTFTGIGTNIPDDGTSIDFDIPVSGLPNLIDTNNFGVETVCINLYHTYDSDLDISLIAPDGTQVMLTSGNGGSGQNYFNTCFNQNASTSITLGTPPFTGTYKPQGQLGIVNNFQNPNGIWKLHILDTYPFADAGIMFNWSISFGNNPASAYFLISSDLPIVIVNTLGQGIQSSPKIMAHMGIIDNGQGQINLVSDTYNNFNGMIGISTRGHSSQGFPQKQFSIETRDTTGNNLDTILLGMPAENDWILYGPYTDKACMRNRLTYKLSNDMNRYAVRGRYCELVLNGGYQGIYELTENIKRDSARVHIAKLTENDTIGDDLTGGYIVKIDWVDGPSWQSSHLPDQTNPANNVIKFQLAYPNPNTVLPVQQNYIQHYVDSFENALAANNFTDPTNGWRKYADENSFIDFFILNEISKNVDGYRLSTYFNKDKNSKGGKIHMGPVWDFNLAWRNADYCGAELNSGWAYRITDYCSTDLPFWWKRFMLDPQFKNHLKCRWTDLRTNVLDTASIFAYMDSVALLLNQAQTRHFTQWPILGTYVWPNPAPLANTYQEEVNNTKQWIANRLAWLDANMPGACSPAGDFELTGNTEFNIYPNPVSEFITVTTFHQFNNKANIKIYDAIGRIIANPSFNTDNAGNDKFKLDISFLQNGIYFVQVFDEGISIGIKKVVKL